MCFGQDSRRVSEWLKGGSVAPRYAFLRQRQESGETEHSVRVVVQKVPLENGEIRQRYSPLPRSSTAITASDILVLKKKGLSYSNLPNSERKDSKVHRKVKRGSRASGSVEASAANHSAGGVSARTRPTGSSTENGATSSRRRQRHSKSTKSSNVPSSRHATFNETSAAQSTPSLRHQNGTSQPSRRNFSSVASGGIVAQGRHPEDSAALSSIANQVSDFSQQRSEKSLIPRQGVILPQTDDESISEAPPGSEESLELEHPDHGFQQPGMDFRQSKAFVFDETHEAFEG